MILILQHPSHHTRNNNGLANLLYIAGRAWLASPAVVEHCRKLGEVLGCRTLFPI